MIEFIISFLGGIQEDDLRKIQRELGVIDKLETKRKSVWKTAIKTNVEREILNAIKQAYTTEGLDTIKETFAPSEGKKSKYQSAIENGLAPVGSAILKDDYFQIQNVIRNFDHSYGNRDEIIEAGVTIASEILFLDADQVTNKLVSENSTVIVLGFFEIPAIYEYYLNILFPF